MGGLKPHRSQHGTERVKIRPRAIETLKNRKIGLEDPVKSDQNGVKRMCAALQFSGGVNQTKLKPDTPMNFSARYNVKTNK